MRNLFNFYSYIIAKFKWELRPCSRSGCEDDMHATVPRGFRGFRDA